MCIAAVLKPGGTISDEDVHRMFRSNSNGAGLAYVKTIKGTPEVVIAKGFFSSDAWLDAIRQAQTRADKDSPILLHARIATQGKVCLDNCHPFRIKNGALIHNGSLWWGIGGRSLEKSDTREFAERMFNNLVYEDIAENPARIEVTLEHNKLAMLFSDKRYIILNERKGEWLNEGKLWVSNCGWRHASPLPCTAFQN